MRKQLTALAAATACTVAVCAPTADAATLRPTQIVGFQWLSGQVQWQQSNVSRLGRSAFVFDRSGGFAMFQPDGYPALRGAWQSSGSGGRVFRGTFSFSTYGGLSTAEVQGVQRGRTIRLVYSAGQSIAAVLNCNEHGYGCTSYGLSNTKAYAARIRVQQG